MLNHKILSDIIRDANVYLPIKVPALFVVLFHTKKEFTVMPVAAADEMVDITRRGKTITQEDIGTVFEIKHPQYPYWRVCTVSTFLEERDEL